RRRRVLRLALVLHGWQLGPASSRQTSGTEEQSDCAGRAPSAAQRFLANDVLRWLAIPRRVQGRYLRKPARFMESIRSLRLRSGSRSAQERACKRNLPGLSHWILDQERRRLGPAGGRCCCAGWISLGFRRWLRLTLAGQLRRYS